MAWQADGAAHEEDIWDDSALVNSWNEALAEYKKYHSIHATGGSLDDPSPEHAKPETSRSHSEAVSQEQPDHHEGKGVVAGAGAGAGPETHATAGAAKGRIDDDDLTAKRDAREEPRGPRDGNCAASAMPTPQALLGSMQDESLKRLLMSWYYAGYYTGLHQGQQRHQE